ncbi:MAG: PBSX family phage terminase large subunit [Nitrospirae bacterium]|nr:MAG: PBSX family phage terminase large subunit [Nitrospirota bacterium]
MSRTLRIKHAAVFEPLVKPARYKGIWGGRGSGKSHFFAELLIAEAIREPGLRALCVRETQMSLIQSSKQLIETKLQALNVGHLFEVQHDKIRTPGGGVFVFQGMQDHTAETVKSFEGFQRCWVEEAQAFSERSLALLRPTIRAPGSQIWASWNPRRKSDAMDKFFRGGDKIVGSVILKANWQDNPWFPVELEAERQIDLIRYPDRYGHIWDGEYAKAFEGAYFARELLAARKEGRICFVPRDPILSIRAYWDIGGAGAKADAMAIWIVQFICEEIRLLNYIEGVGQPLSYYADALRVLKLGPIVCVLPHDGTNTSNITGKKYKDHVEDAGFEVRVVENQGMGAAMQRIEAARRIFPMCRFNEATTEAGREALGFYHERRDEHRNVGLGPEHDWASHCADAFGLMAIDYEKPRKHLKKLEIPNAGYV